MCRGIDSSRTLGMMIERLSMLRSAVPRRVGTVIVRPDSWTALRRCRNCPTPILRPARTVVDDPRVLCRCKGREAAKRTPRGGAGSVAPLVASGLTEGSPTTALQRLSPRFRDVSVRLNLDPWIGRLRMIRDGVETTKVPCDLR